VVDDGSNPTIARMIPDNVNLGDIDCTPNGVFKALGSIKPNSACGPDGMSPRFLYMLRHDLCVPLALIFGALFREGVVPNTWLQSCIMPVFKKGLTCDPNNYRTIALTCIAYRVMEKIIRDAITKYLFEHKLISKAQHGFLVKRSTVTNLLECTQNWTVAMANRSATGCIYIDFKSAFDLVSHQKLLNKLNAFGIDASSTQVAQSIFV